MDAGQDRAAVPGRGLDARYEQLRHAALHTRAEAFPLGLAVLTGRGVTAWQRALAQLASPPHPPTTAPTPATPPALALAPAPALALPGRLAAELVHALAAVALAQGDPCRCPPTPPRRR